MPNPLDSGLASQALLQAGGPDMTRYVLVCCLLLAAIGGLAYLFRRFLASGLKRRAARRSLEVLDLLPLGGKKKLIVVRCYDRNFFLAVGEKEVHSVAEIDADSEPLPAASAPATSAFPAALSAVLARVRSTPGAGAADDPVSRGQSDPVSNAEVTARRRAATGRPRVPKPAATDRSVRVPGEGVLG